MRGRMRLIPAVDLMDGRLVRLTKGDPLLAKKYYHDNPLEVAMMWKRKGASLLHVVDLDAALGSGSNLELVEGIIRSVGIPVQVGGGIRDYGIAKDLLEEGAWRIILGTMAFTNPETLTRILEEYGGDRVVISLDFKGFQVVVRGWREAAGMDISDALRRFEDIGIHTFLATDVERDGTLQGPSLPTVKEIRRLSRGDELMVAGGIRDLEDLIELERIGVDGVILGKALYEGRIDFQEALKSLGG